MITKCALRLSKILRRNMKSLNPVGLKANDLIRDHNTVSALIKKRNALGLGNDVSRFMRHGDDFDTLNKVLSPIGGYGGMKLNRSMKRYFGPKIEKALSRRTAELSGQIY